MANFPTGVYGPAAKANGQTITAAMFNDPDGEITAIEDGYLNGTARLNSSKSTVASLSVAGGSTLAGTLSVAGGSTFAVRPIVPPPEMVLVFRDSTAVLASSARSTIVWNAESYVGNSSMHSTGTNPSRLIPQSTGFYRFDLQFQGTQPSALSGFFAQILDSTGTVIGSQGAEGAGQWGVGASAYKRFDAIGSYCVAEFLNNSGGSTMSLSSGVGVTWFAMVKL